MSYLIAAIFSLIYAGLAFSYPVQLGYFFIGYAVLTLGVGLGTTIRK